jgi:Inosine-uridine nucleoside N-ribohydrolase
MKPEAPVRMVLDTDTFNEVDDQFTLAYALRSPERLRVEACYAAPFHNARSTGAGDGMEKSYEEILRVLSLLGEDLGGHVHRGATSFLAADGRPVESDAVRDLISRALDDSEPGPLHVVGIAAATNLASAILIEPRIVNRVRMIWLGGHPLDWPTADEFNLRQDVRAARVLFDSGVPLTLIPCKNVAEHLRVTAADLREALPTGHPLCDFLRQRFDLYLREKGFLSKPLWDVAAIARLVNPEWVPVAPARSPRITDDLRWDDVPSARHSIQVATQLRRDPIFVDLCRKLVRTPVRAD